MKTLSLLICILGIKVASSSILPSALLLEEWEVSFFSIISVCTFNSHVKLVTGSGCLLALAPAEYLTQHISPSLHWKFTQWGVTWSTIHFCISALKTKSTTWSVARATIFKWDKTRKDTKDNACFARILSGKNVEWDIILTSQHPGGAGLCGPTEGCPQRLWMLSGGACAHWGYVHKVQQYRWGLVSASGGHMVNLVTPLSGMWWSRKRHEERKSYVWIVFLMMWTFYSILCVCLWCETREVCTFQIDGKYDMRQE